MIQPGEVRKYPKITKIEGYNTRFRTFLRPSSRRFGMRSWDMRGHCKAVTWLGEYMNVFTFISEQF